MAGLVVRQVVHLKDTIGFRPFRREVQAMRNDWLDTNARKLKFWSIVAPGILIALCAVVAAREGLETSWNNETIPVILGIALVIFLTMRTVACALDWLTNPKGR